MTTFKFPLQKALDWRRTQLEVAEARTQEQLAALAAIDQARAELDAMGQRTEVEVRQFAPLDGSHLGALGTFRLAIRARGRDLVARRAECEKELAVRQSAVLEARRRCRLLERLKERRWAEWHKAAERELDELAADSYLAHWARRRALSI
jgi:hypothetical protein